MLHPALLIAGLLSLSQLTNAFWRLPCNKLIAERIDPIVNSGAVSGHVHTISGGSNISPFSTFEDMRASECSSCKVKQDMSAYWTPSLYFQWANGSFTSVDQLGGGLIYYLQRFHSSDKTEVLAFPDGLRVLTGSPALRSYNASSRMADAIGWNCLGGSINPTRNPYLPSVTCPGGLRGEIRFPSCWNGKDLDFQDHFSHMAYSDGESGPCPSTHPYRVATLFFEMLWDVASFDKYRNQAKNPSQPFVLATGDSTGYGYHGDFLNGWDRDVLQRALRECTDPSGVIELCKVFDLYDGDAHCSKTPDVDEIVTGTLKALPGCNPVTNGPEKAVACAAPNAPAIFQQPASYTGKAPPPGSDVLANQPKVLESYNGWEYQDCYSDSVAARSLPTGLTTTAKTVEACLDACAAKNFAFCGVEYHGQCWGGDTLAPSAKAVGFGYCDLTCDDNPLQYCGGGNPTAMELYARGSKLPSTSNSPKPTSISHAVSSAVNPNPASSIILVSSSATKSTPSSSASQTSSTVSVSATSVKTSSVATSSVPSVTSSKPTTSASTSSSASASPSQNAGKLLNSAAWTYSGCFSDLVQGARSLPNRLSSNDTIEGCLAASEKARYAVAALSYKGECWAAKALSPLSTELDASRCQMKCSGAPSTTCGGAAALDIYISKTVPVLVEPKTPNLAKVAGYSFSGCYSDPVNPRSLSKTLSSNATIEGCIAACSAAKFAVCGLEFYGECYGGAKLASASVPLNATSCAYPCKGNPLESCGGAAALSVYTFDGVSSSSHKLMMHKRHVFSKYH